MARKQVPVYFTIDLDCLDPSVFPGTGTPEAVSYTHLFLCVTFTIFANNIANGICVALPTYLVMKIAAGKIKKVEPVMYVLVAVCLLYFYSII